MAEGCDLQPLSGREMLPGEVAVPIRGGSDLFSEVFPSAAKSDRDCESEIWAVWRSPSVV